MKQILFFAVFTTTLFGGIASSNTINVRGTIDKYVHQDCSRWVEDWVESETFTFEEAKELLNKKVRWNKANLKDKIARIVQFHIIADGKFVVSVWYGKETDTKQITAFYVNKQQFEEEFTVLD